MVKPFLLFSQLQKTFFRNIYYYHKFEKINKKFKELSEK